MSGFSENKIVASIKRVNWSYRLDQIKDRIFYIIGFLIVVTIPWFSDFSKASCNLGPVDPCLPIREIGMLYQDFQHMQVIPNDTGLALLLSEVAIIVIFVVSWDLLSGYSGQISFGHALFFGLGAYMTILIKSGYVGDIYGYEYSGRDNDIQTIPILETDVNIAMLYSIIFAAFIVSLFAVFLGTLTLRSKGPYFALITLVLPFIFLELVKIEELEDYTGGADTKILSTREGIVPEKSSDDLTVNTFNNMLEEQFKVILLITIICVTIMYMIAKSRIGIVLQAIREDELAASASGINVSFYKVLAFWISSFFAAIAGGLAPNIFRSASPTLFGASRSFQPIIFSIIGGIGSITGPLIGAVFLFTTLDLYVSEAFIETPTIDTLALAILLIAVLKFQPLGIVRATKRVRNAIFFAFGWAATLVLYDAGNGNIRGMTRTSIETTPKITKVPNESYLGRFFEWLYETTGIMAPEDFFFEYFRDGILSIDTGNIEGRVFLYFVTGLFLGFYGPRVFQSLRLRIWGVWPSLGNYDPPS